MNTTGQRFVTFKMLNRLKLRTRTRHGIKRSLNQYLSVLFILELIDNRPRKMELLTMTWEDINFEDGAFKLRTNKSGGKGGQDNPTYYFR